MELWYTEVQAFARSTKETEVWVPGLACTIKTCYLIRHGICDGSSQFGVCALATSEICCISFVELQSVHLVPHGNHKCPQVRLALLRTGQRTAPVLTTVAGKSHPWLWVEQTEYIVQGGRQGAVYLPARWGPSRVSSGSRRRRRRRSVLLQQVADLHDVRGVRRRSYLGARLLHRGQHLQCTRGAFHLSLNMEGCLCLRMMWSWWQSCVTRSRKPQSQQLGDKISYMDMGA